MRFPGGAALIAATTLLVLTGCGSQAAQPTSSPTVTVAAPTSPPSSSPASSAAPAPTDTVTVTFTPTAPPATSAADPGRPSNQCADSDLGVTVTVNAGGGGAGSEEYRVLFTNTGGSSCALRGTPGVSVVGDGNGTQIGVPAQRLQSDVKTITLSSGGSAAAPLRIVNIGTNGGPLGSKCGARGADGYRVYAPHSKKAFFVKDGDAVACASGTSFMTVGPVYRFSD